MMLIEMLWFLMVEVEVEVEAVVIRVMRESPNKATRKIECTNINF